MFDPSNAFIDCPKCDSARHVERVKGAQWFCNCCAHQFAVPSTAPEAGSLMGRVAREEVRQPTAALQFVTAVALLLLLPTAGNAQGRVFYEPGDGSSKAATDCEPSTTASDGVAHRNGAALRCGWDGTLGWQDSAKTRELELASVPMTSERLISAWFRVDQNVDAKAGSKLMRVGYGSANEIIVSCQFENSPATLWMGLNNHASYWGGVAAAHCRDGWTRIRIYTSESLVRVWLGDVLLREWVGTFAVSSMATFMSQWSNNPGWDHDALNHVYWDDIEIFSDAGTGGTGSMRDGTMTQGGSTPPPAANVTYTCAVTGTPSGYADGDVRRTIRCDTNGPVGTLPVGATFTVTVPRR